MQPQLVRREDSVLLLVDIQVRLAAAMAGAERAQVERSAGILAQAAALLGVPVLVTEQYPRGLGATTDPVATKLPPQTPVLEKSCFACTDAAPVQEQLNELHRRQVVVAGMESHVCVLQTAFGLAADGYQVFVVEDAICSRSPLHHRNAIERMRACAVISNSESVLFEWLRDAQHPQFKAVSALIK